MAFGEIVLTSVMGITALLSAEFTLYMLKITIWSEPTGTKIPQTEVERVDC